MAGRTLYQVQMALGGSALQSTWVHPSDGGAPYMLYTAQGRPVLPPRSAVVGLLLADAHGADHALPSTTTARFLASAVTAYLAPTVMKYLQGCAECVLAKAPRWGDASPVARGVGSASLLVGVMSPRAVAQADYIAMPAHPATPEPLVFLTLADLFTRRIWVSPVGRAAESGDGLAEDMVLLLLASGQFSEVRSDSGPGFSSAVFAGLMSRLHIRHVRGPPHHHVGSAVHILSGMHSLMRPQQRALQGDERVAAELLPERPANQRHERNRVVHLRSDGRRFRALGLLGAEEVHRAVVSLQESLQRLVALV